LWSYMADGFILKVCGSHESTKKGAAVMKKEHAKVCAVTDSRLLDKLTKNAEVVCARCGAKAHDKGSLCDPVAVEPDH